MKILWYILGLIICFGVGYIIGSQNEPIVETTTEYLLGDTVRSVVIRDSIVPKYHYTTLYDTIIKYDTILQTVDTGAILKDYYSSRIYNDTLRNDTSMFVSVYDSISRNRLVHRYAILQNKRPSIVNTTLVYTNGIYLGGSFGLSTMSIGAEYLKNKNMFGISLNLVNTNNSTKFVPSISYKRKIWNLH